MRSAKCGKDRSGSKLLLRTDRRETASSPEEREEKQHYIDSLFTAQAVAATAEGGGAFRTLLGNEGPQAEVLAR